MSNEPGTSPNSTEEGPEVKVEEKMAELETMKAELTAELDRAKSEREGLANLNETLRTLTTPQPAQAEPEPLPTAEEFEADSATASARVAGRVTTEALRSYHSAIAPELQELKQGLRRIELDAVKTSDPKNFKRLEKEITEVLDKYPNYSSGLAERVFYQVRGRKYNELREMDRTESLSEPVPPTNSSIGDKRSSKSEEYDSLDEVVLVHGIQKNPADVARRLGVKQEDYFKHKHGREMRMEGADASK